MLKKEQYQYEYEIETCTLYW